VKTACIISLVLSTTGVIPNKLHKSLKMLSLRPAPYILMQKAAILNTCRMVRKLLAESWPRLFET
jgi:hypothetical protein